jgi:hypothetical protein
LAPSTPQPSLAKFVIRPNNIFPLRLIATYNKNG